MSFFSNFFNKKNTAPVAKDRLQILLAHERSSQTSNSDLLQKLQKEIMEVIQKHIAIDQEKIHVKVDRGNDFSTLEIDIEVPQQNKTNN
ncbi:Septum formation topological specificity factor MinE (MinE) (PDB:1EV0) [Commensalibacter communis]|uniref:Cell division topological specificity factor n=1 Tax=Commensalibacter communis TaxID=2972786 RepID=A0A9W4TLV6_9PROT|nr:cell division topological specificity factor MinE [Commensalibacter communis]CAI3924879.1 Septum formation topological specificity factor MinE (MinE) (PDB:1EV0) [Commensalibacter communis]CAI3926386.1 Septum formation topological specificity factor MinE (MinE) (PDB:1EV0) [Commensalibacter communis]CAI3926401.1 Septum formation topological specificity factor MinE (MinE) (PDB:1EV0) [Commensalibacter communis]CAI3926625.1 Septum formation topological specificity factor MinE (MinE) (PDB:1EV0) [C